MRARIVDWLEYRLDRALCPFGIHGPSCRGRADHSPQVGRWR